MAVIDLTLNNATSRQYGSLGNYGSAAQNTRNIPSICSRTFTTSSTVKLLAANQYKIMTIPAGAFVRFVSCIIKTATGETSTLDVGDNDSGTQYLSSMDINGTAGTSVTSAVTAGRFYSAANNIVLDPDHDLDLNGVFTIVAEIIYPD